MLNGIFSITAVLVAISIPVFTTQLAKAELATDLANVRAAYAEAVSEALAEGELDKDGKMTVTITDPCTKSKATVSGTTVTVTHLKRTSLSETFTIDSDVTLTIGSGSNSGNGEAST